MTDTATINVPLANSVDELIGNKTNGGVNDVVRIPVADLGDQILGQLFDSYLPVERTIDSFDTGSDDDDTILQAAIAWVNESSGRKVTPGLRTDFTITQTLVVVGSFNVDFGNVRITCAANAKILDCRATLNGPYYLGSDYSAGDLAIDLTGSPLPAAPVAGTVMKIVTDGLDPGDRDKGANATKYRTGEFFIVGVGSTATNIVLDRPLRFTRSISPTSAGGDEAEVDSFTTALNARIVFANNDEKFILRGGIFQHEDGHAADPWVNGAIEVRGFVKPLIENITVGRTYSTGLYLGGTYNAVIDNPSFSRGEDNTSQAQYGYGIADAAHGTRINNIRGYDLRHIYTSASSTFADNAADPVGLITAGRVVGTVVSGRASGGASTHWDTHQSTTDAIFRDTFSEGGGSYVFAARGQNVVSDGMVARNCGLGIFHFTEYDSGDTDDDFFTNGKTLADFTSAVLNNAQIECDEVPYINNHAAAKLAGIGRFVSQDHCAVYLNGGTLIVEGNQEFITIDGSVSHGRDACIDIDAPNPASPFSKAYMIVEGTMLIDATNAAAGTLYAMNLAANTEVIVRGRLRLFLPQGVTGFKTGAGTIRTQGAGLIEYSIDNNFDNAIGSATEFDGARVQSTDGLVDWFGAPGWHLLYSDPSVGASHTGNTTETVLLNPDCQDASYVMNQAGEGHMRFEFTGQKSGSGGTAELQIESNGSNFVWNGTIAASDSVWKVICDVYFTGVNTQVYVVRFQSGTAATLSTNVMQRRPETQAFGTTGQAARLTVTLANSGDTVTLDHCDVWATKGGRI